MTGKDKYIGFTLMVLLTASICFTLYRYRYHLFSRYPAEVEQALKLAGDNRGELEKVLDHYGKQPEDGLKYKAACFLIENMPYHFWYEGKQLDDYSNIYEALMQKKDAFFVLDSFQTKFGTFSWSGLTGKYDIQEITSAYLIQNIEWAFKVWNEQPWGQSLSFDDFCNYVLPYRVNVEHPVEWRQYLYEKYNPLLDSFKNTNEATDPLHAAQAIMDFLCLEDKFFTAQADLIPLVNPLILDRHRGASCRNMADLTVYILRALGIPCGIEYFPIHGRLNAPHCWTFILDKNGKTYTSDYLDCSILPATEALHFTAKIYRETFSVNQTVKKETAGFKNSIAPFLINPRFIDVTDQYTNTFSIHIPKPEYTFHTKPSVVYLCAAQFQNWLPITWGYIEDGQISFDNIKVTYATTDTFMLRLTSHSINLIPETIKDHLEAMVLRVASMENNRLQYLTDPFIFRKNGTKEFLKPGEEKQTICVFSKFNPLSDGFVQHMSGGVFEASSDRGFNHVDTLFQIRKIPMRLFNTAWINTDKKYRYIRYRGADNTSCGISEIQIFGDLDSPALKGKVLGYILDGDEIEKHGFENAFDGDPYTSFYSPNPNGDWVGIDLGQPFEISKIVYTPRNRDNFVRTGDQYELYYLEEETWQSLGVKIAESDSLIFENAPSNTLYYLKNHTRGKDERIFHYKDNTQIFF